MNYTLNFGALKDSILRFSAQKLIKEQKENSILKDFLTEVKSNPMFKIEYLIFKNLEEGCFKKSNLAERYINENLNLIKKFNWNQLSHEHKVLRKKYFPEEYLCLAETSKRELYENIAVLVESVTKPGYTNINKSEESYDFVLNHLLSEKTSFKEDKKIEDTDMPSIFSWKYITEKAVNNFNERYSHLNENEQNILKALLQNEGEKKLYLENLVKENETLLKNARRVLNESLKPSLDRFESKIKSIKINETKNIDEDILNLEELKETLSN
jgi:hypothetical protein